MIPLVNLSSQYEKIKPEILKKMEEVLESTHFIQGKYVAEFEQKFNKILGAHYGSACANGTCAIELALRALNIGKGDEVIVPTHTFFATAESVVNAGAQPIFCDISENDYTIDINAIEKLITSKTKAIIPVHLYGIPAQMDQIMDLAKAHHLYVIEDAAQAHLAQFKGATVGTFGDAATFSFFPGKNLGAYGDAGYVVSHNKEVNDLVRKLLDHGRSDKYTHEYVGHNFRMDGLQAGILLVKLKYLKEWTEARRTRAKTYDSLLKKNGFKPMPSPENTKPSYHLYIVQVKNRNQALDFLKTNGIAASIHYPIPLHLQPAFKYLGYKRGDFPTSEHISGHILSLPICPEITDEKIEFIVNTFNQVAQN